MLHYSNLNVDIMTLNRSLEGGGVIGKEDTLLVLLCSFSIDLDILGADLTMK